MLTRSPSWKGAHSSGLDGSAALEGKVLLLFKSSFPTHPIDLY